MEKTPKEMLKAYVDSQKFSSTTEIMDAMKEMFRDVLQQVMESELDTELGYEKSQRMILSILVDTFFTRISMPKQHPEIHRISVV